MKNWLPGLCYGAPSPQEGGEGAPPRTVHSLAHWWPQKHCLVSWYQACLLLMALLPAVLHDASVHKNVCVIYLYKKYKNILYRKILTISPSKNNPPENKPLPQISDAKFFLIIHPPEYKPMDR